MANKTLTHHAHQQHDTLPVRDRMQIALAIADQAVLKSLLVNCAPPLAQPHLIGNISSSISVPSGSTRKTVDGMLQFEKITCRLVNSPAEINHKLAERNNWDHTHREFSSLTRCESETHILGQTITLAQSLSLLAQAGFAPDQVEAILNLPYEAWHKSWWYTLDADGSFTVPFLRLIRTLRYSDGTFTIQYKDYFSYEKPSCFKSLEQKVLIEIKPTVSNFRKTLSKINQSREDFGIDKALLICDSLSELEARGFISQGISIYSADEIILPVDANCSICTTHDCPLNGSVDSPVMTCRRFCL